MMSGEASNLAVKTCPYCKLPLRSSGGTFEIVRRGMSAADSHARLPVSLYSCPKCGYTEMYNLRVTAGL